MTASLAVERWLLDRLLPYAESRRTPAGTSSCWRPSWRS
jgi:hypothetical protein